MVWFSSFFHRRSIYEHKRGRKLKRLWLMCTTTKQHRHKDFVRWLPIVKWLYLLNQRESETPNGMIFFLFSLSFYFWTRTAPQIEAFAINSDDNESTQGERSCPVNEKPLSFTIAPLEINAIITTQAVKKAKTTKTKGTRTSKRKPRVS